MHKTPINDEPLFAGPPPKSPASMPPDRDTLVSRVRRRRRNRRVLKVSALSASALCAAGLTINLIGMERPSVDSPRLVDPTSLPSVAAIGSRLPDASDEIPPPIQVFARVHRPVPVFDVQEETQSVLHVGWINSEEIVPVDMSQFLDEEQQTIKAVLDENETPDFFNL